MKWGYIDEVYKRFVRSFVRSFIRDCLVIQYPVHNITRGGGRRGGLVRRVVSVRRE